MIRLLHRSYITPELFPARAEFWPLISIIVIIVVSLAILESEAGAHYGNNKRCVICYCCNRKTFYQYLILTVNCWLEINTNTARAPGPCLSLEDLSIFWWLDWGWGWGNYINWTTPLLPSSRKYTGETKLI